MFLEGIGFLEKKMKRARMLVQRTSLVHCAGPVGSDDEIG